MGYAAAASGLDRSGFRIKSPGCWDGCRIPGARASNRYHRGWGSPLALVLLKIRTRTVMATGASITELGKIDIIELMQTSVNLVGHYLVK